MTTPDRMPSRSARTGRPARLAGWLPAVAVAVAVAVSAAAAPQPAAAQGNTKGNFGDWQIRCDVPPGAKTEQCALVQRVADEIRSNVALDDIASWRKQFDV